MSSQNDFSPKPAAPPARGLMDLIARRFSCRAYKSDLVPKEHLMQLLEAARLAPSACNKQPWRFAVVTDIAIRRQIVEKGFLPGAGMNWALDAPAHVVIGIETSFITHRLGAAISGVDYPWMDIGIAGEHLVLAATELGLGTCWIGWIKSGTVARIVSWPRSVKAAAVITIGYPAVAGHGSSTSRKPLDEIARWL